MTHPEFIAKLATYKKVADEYALTKSYKYAAERFGLYGAMQAANAVAYYETHKSDAQCPQFGDLSHATVKAAALRLPLNDEKALRHKLIANYSASVVGHKPYPTFVSKRTIRLILKKSGLEWFEKDGEPLVHWKHDAELV